MKGSEIKRAIADNGRTITEVAAAIGKSQQNLSAALASDDVKSSLIEAIADYLDLPDGNGRGSGLAPSLVLLKRRASTTYGRCPIFSDGCL